MEEIKDYPTVDTLYSECLQFIKENEITMGLKDYQGILKDFQD